MGGIVGVKQSGVEIEMEERKEERAELGLELGGGGSEKSAVVSDPGAEEGRSWMDGRDSEREGGRGLWGTGRLAWRIRGTWSEELQSIDWREREWDWRRGRLTRTKSITLEYVERRNVGPL